MRSGVTFLRSRHIELLSDPALTLFLLRTRRNLASVMSNMVCVCRPKTRSSSPIISGCVDDALPPPLIMSSDEPTIKCCKDDKEDG